MMTAPRVRSPDLLLEEVTKSLLMGQESKCLSISCKRVSSVDKTQWLPIPLRLQLSGCIPGMSTWSIPD